MSVLAAWPAARRAGRLSPMAALRDSAAETAVGGLGTLRLATAGGGLLLGAGVIAAGLTGSASAALPHVLAGSFLVLVGVTALAPLAVEPTARVLRRPFRHAGAAGRVGLRNAARSPRRVGAAAAALTIGVGAATTASTASWDLSTCCSRSRWASPWSGSPIRSCSP